MRTLMSAIAIAGALLGGTPVYGQAATSANHRPILEAVAEFALGVASEESGSPIPPTSLRIAPTSHVNPTAISAVVSRGMGREGTIENSVACEANSRVCQGRDGARAGLNIVDVELDSSTAVVVADVWYVYEYKGSPRLGGKAFRIELASGDDAWKVTSADIIARR